ncbi:MAG: HD-GYP domain-containing protein [bacterium]
MRIISVESLTSEMKLAKALYYNNTVLLNIGAKDLFLYKEKLLNLGINYLYVEDEFSKDIDINDMIKDETRQNGINIVKETLERVSMCENLNIKTIKSFIFDLLDEILNFDNILVNLIDIKSYSSYTFAHSVNVAAIAILIGKLLKYDMDKLFDLGIGALLHDIGKVLLPPEILKKPAKVTAEEFEILKEHPRLGYDYIKKYDEISPRARIIVLSHHERLDGSGYPKGSSGDEIHDFARIVVIADVYDALLSDRIYRKSWSINDVLEYLIANVNTKFDFTFTEIFTRNIAIYPNGITVLLSNGQKAIIKEQNPGFPLRPTVLIIENTDGSKVEETMEINLINELDIIITEII